MNFDWKNIKDKVQKSGEALKDTWDVVSDKTVEIAEATVDAAKNADQTAVDLQVKALQNKIELAALSWDAIYVDEMLDGTKGQPEGAATGAAILKQLEKVLIKAQSRITTIATGEKVGNVLTSINEALDTDKNSAEAYATVYEALTKVNAGLTELSEDAKVQNAIAKQGNTETYNNLVAAFNYDGRCENVLARGNFNDLVLLATEETTADVLNIKGDQVAAIKAVASEDSSATLVGAGRYVLGVLNEKSATVFAFEDDADKISEVSNNIGTYNLSLSVPKDALSLTKHYGGQVLNATVDYTGKAISGTNKAVDWVKGQLNKEPK